MTLTGLSTSNYEINMVIPLIASVPSWTTKTNVCIEPLHSTDSPRVPLYNDNRKPLGYRCSRKEADDFGLCQPIPTETLVTGGMWLGSSYWAVETEAALSSRSASACAYYYASHYLRQSGWGHSTCLLLMQNG